MSTRPTGRPRRGAGRSGAATGAFGTVGLSAALAGCAPGPAAPTASATSPVPAAATAFRDGRWSAEGVYGTGPSSIGVALTLEAGVITGVQVAPRATNPTSLQYQRDFAEGVPAVVVGRPIADLTVGTVSGSSSTPDGFNDALDQIRDDAAR